MFGALDTSTSALVAQRTRMETIAANMANQYSIENAKGEYEPYRRRMVVFSPGDPSRGSEAGVHVKKIMLDDAPLRKVYDPGHPYADKSGYVKYPNVNSAVESINAVEASRAYEANITVAEATKNMLSTSLRLLG